MKNKPKPSQAEFLLEQLIIHTTGVRNKAKSYGKIFEENYPDINAFTAIHNGLVLTHELFDYYYNKWLKREKKQEIVGQDEERVMTIGKWAYVHTFSIIEYTSKELMKKKKCEKFKQVNSLLAQGKRVKFWDIIEESSKEEIKAIDTQDKLIWDGLRKTRNTIAHNNSIADVNFKFEYKSVDWNNRQFVLELKKGESIKFNLFLGIILIEIAIELYYKFLQKIISIH